MWTWLRQAAALTHPAGRRNGPCPLMGSCPQPQLSGNKTLGSTSKMWRYLPVLSAVLRKASCLYPPPCRGLGKRRSWAFPWWGLCGCAVFTTLEKKGLPRSPEEKGRGAVGHGRQCPPLTLRARAQVTGAHGPLRPGPPSLGSLLPPPTSGPAQRCTPLGASGCPLTAGAEVDPGTA